MNFQSKNYFCKTGKAVIAKKIEK